MSVDEKYHAHDLDNYILSRDRVRRSTRIPYRYNDYVDINLIIYALNTDLETNIPRTYQESISSANSNKWKRAMHEEIASLPENNT